MNLRKLLPTVAVIVGVALCAAGGAQLGRQDLALTIDQGRLAAGSEAVLDNVSLPPARERVAQWWAQGGVPFAFGLIVLVAGAWRARRDHAGEVIRDSGDQVDFEARLKGLVEAILSFRDAFDTLSEQSACTQIERIQQDFVEPVVEARALLEQSRGAAVYGAVIGALAGSERMLNRTWSALVDGHRQEAAASLDLALSQAQSAHEACVA